MSRNQWSRRRTTLTTGPAIVMIAALVACGRDTGREPARRASTNALSGGGNDDTGLVLHTVPPKETDPNITLSLADHYAWIDSNARTRHQLFVFMPGAGSVSKDHQLVQKEAARVGYHSVGLTFATGANRALGAMCGEKQPSEQEACYENSRLELLDGIDRSDVVNVDVPNSIYNRLTMLLQHLAKNHPHEGWSRFLKHDRPRWSRIAIAGQSLGGGQAAMIAKLHVVARVAMFSSPPDRVERNGSFDAAAWVATHVTPAKRYWGLAHERDPLPIRTAWVSLGMAPFGPGVAPEASSPPYGFTHRLVTDLVPQIAPPGAPYTFAHVSVSRDAQTPIGSDQTPLLRDAWRHMLTAEADDDDADDDGDERE